MERPRGAGVGLRPGGSESLEGIAVAPSPVRLLGGAWHRPGGDGWRVAGGGEIARTPPLPCDTGGGLPIPQGCNGAGEN